MSTATTEPSFAHAHDDWLTHPADRVGHWQAREIVDDAFNRHLAGCMTSEQTAKADNEILDNDGPDLIDELESAKGDDVLVVARKWQKKIRELRAEYANRLRDKGALDISRLYPT